MCIINFSCETNDLDNKMSIWIYQPGNLDEIFTTLNYLKVKNDHRSKFRKLSNWKEKPEKYQSFNGTRTLDLRDTGAMLGQLGCEATRWKRGQFVEWISSRSGFSLPIAQREFKNLQRQLQRKRHIKIELCDYSMLITLYKIGEVHFRLLGMNVFHVKVSERVKNFLLRARVFIRTSNMKISRRRLSDTS